VHFRPLAAWYFSALPDTFRSISVYVGVNPVFHGGMWLVTAIGLAAIPTLRRRGGEVRWLAVITAIVWVGYNAFLILVYLAAFSEAEAHGANDYWRYTPHAALLALATVLVAIAKARPPVTVPWGAMAPICAAVALAAPLLRSDFATTHAKRWPLFVRGVTAELKSLLPPGAGLALVVGPDPNPFPVIVRYDLWQRGDPARAINSIIVWYTEDLKRVDDLVAAGEVQYLILHDPQPSVAALAARLGVPPPDQELVLFKHQNGHWVKIKSWPIPPADRPD